MATCVSIYEFLSGRSGRYSVASLKVRCQQRFAAWAEGGCLEERAGVGKSGVGTSPHEHFYLETPLVVAGNKSLPQEPTC